MPGFSDISHCDTECGRCGCLIADEDDLTEECASGFTLVGSNWETTTSGAFLHTDLSITDPWHVKADFTIVWNTGHANWVTDESTCYLYFHGGLLDCDSYWFGIIKFTKPAGSTSYRRRRELWVNNNGTLTLISAYPYVGNSDEVYLGSFDDIRYGICWNGESLMFAAHSGVTLGVFDLPTLLQGNLGSPPGEKAGVSVVFTGHVTKVIVDDFSYALLVDEQSEISGQKDCDTCTPNCCRGPTPPILNVEISLTGTTNTSSNCPGPIDCSSIVGTFPTAANNYNPGGGDGQCGWLYEFNSPTGQVCYGVVARFRITVTLATVVGQPFNSDQRKVTIIVEHINGGFGAPSLIAAFSAIVTTACEDWTDWVNIAKDTILLSNQCNSNSTIASRIKIGP